MNNHQEKEFLIAYEELADLLFRYCYFKTGDRELARDMVQDVFMKTWVYIEKGQDVQNFKTFLYHIASNLVVDWYRKKKTIALDALAEHGFDPVDTTVNIEAEAELQQVMKVFSKLDKVDQDLITLRYIEDLPLQEICTILNQTQNVISVRLHRAMTRLKHLLR